MVHEATELQLLVFTYGYELYKCRIWNFNDHPGLLLD